MGLAVVEERGGWERTEIYKAPKMAEGTCWQERGKQEKRYRELRETKRC